MARDASFTMQKTEKPAELHQKARRPELAGSTRKKYISVLSLGIFIIITQSLIGKLQLHRSDTTERFFLCFKPRNSRFPLQHL